MDNRGRSFQLPSDHPTNTDRRQNNPCQPCGSLLDHPHKERGVEEAYNIDMKLVVLNGFILAPDDKGARRLLPVFRAVVNSDLDWIAGRQCL